LKAEAARERQAARQAADAERQAVQAAMSGQLSLAMTAAEERHAREMDRLRADKDQDEKGLEEARAALRDTQTKLLDAEAKLKAERRRSMEVETREIEAAEARESEIEADQATRAKMLHDRDERQREQRARVAMKFFRGSQERIARLLFATWSRYTKSRRLAAARERAAQLLAAAEDVRLAAVNQASDLAREKAEHDAAVGESIGAMREEALRRHAELEAANREVERLRRQLEAEHHVTEEACEVQRTIEERAALIQRRAAHRLFALHGRNATSAVFVAWRTHIQEVLTSREALASMQKEASRLGEELDDYDARLAELQTKASDQQEKMSRRMYAPLNPRM
jgi:hypothetical protein